MLFYCEKDSQLLFYHHYAHDGVESPGPRFMPQLIRSLSRVINV